MNLQILYTKHTFATATQTLVHHAILLASLNNNSNLTDVPRFFIETEIHTDACAGQTVPLTEALTHHAFRVLRLKPGDHVEVWNGTGHVWSGKIQGNEKRSEVLIGGHFKPSTELRISIEIVQALPEGDKMDWIVEKCTEAGATDFIPIQAERSVVKLNTERQIKRQYHWQRIAIAASSQCGRAVLPTVHTTHTLSQWLNHAPPEHTLRLWLNPVADNSQVLSPTLASLFGPIPETASHMLKNTQRIQLAIGPEGGWSAVETSMAALKGFKTVQLGPRVLRTETAALFALAQLIVLASLDQDD